jgi:alpha-1,2-mannosyltransferase
MSTAVADERNGAVASSSLLDWSPASRKFRLLALALLALFAVYGTAYYLATLTAGSAHPFGDAFGLWSWARFVATHPAPDIYNPATLHAAQVALGMDPHDEFSFAYPPTFLLFLRPLGSLPFLAAVAVMFAVTLPLYLWATTGRDWHSPALLAALVAPTTTMAVVAGQSAFLSAALLVGGFRLIEARPVVAGVLFGCLSYKPQFGVLVPVALVAARQWRTIAAAVATFLVLMFVTAALFGPAIWPDWLAAFPAYSRQFAAESGTVLHLMPTVLAGLLQLGVPAAIAGPAQWLVAVVMAVIVWGVFRDGPRELAAAALFIAVLLATPYAFVYDMPVVTSAVIWVVAERTRAGAAFSTGEMLVLTLILIAPITLPAGNSNFPLVMLSLILGLGVILRRIRSLRISAAVAERSDGSPA